ncbi:MAG: YlxR family protein [Myxococcota bacterium]|nr:YlxR family protein [Myxococcota bacterium]
MVGGPVRTCIGCGRKALQKELRRLALGAAGGVEVDLQGTAPGRGAYLCGPGCLAAAWKRKAFLRAFKGKAGPLDLERLEVALRES